MNSLCYYFKQNVLIQSLYFQGFWDLINNYSHLFPVILRTHPLSTNISLCFECTNLETLLQSAKTNTYLNIKKSSIVLHTIIFFFIILHLNRARYFVFFNKNQIGWGYFIPCKICKICFKLNWTNFSNCGHIKIREVFPA